MNHSGRVPGQSINGDQSALSLLVNAADSRDAPRGQRESNGSLQRSLADTLRLRGLTGDGGPTLEEQLFLQQQSQNAYGGQGNLGLLNQLRDQNMLLSHLGQQQLASLLGLGGGSNQPPDVRQMLAAQLRQSQAQPHLTNADILALTRSGALSGLSNIFGGGNFVTQGGQGAGFGQGGSFGVNQGGGFGGSGAQGLPSDVELQRLEELERRQRLLAEAARGSSSAIGRVESSAPMSATLNTEPTTEQLSSARADNSQNGKFKSVQSPVVEAAMAPESTKEEIEKTTGSVIVPCRARGMPMDHNFKTAFFVIPENVKHGEELICSYFACRNAGIKFRYCSHCKVPVAKRNFRKRHKHGGEIMVKGGDDDSGDEPSTPVKRGIPSQITASREETEEADGISSQSADSTNIVDNKNETEVDGNRAPNRNPERPADLPQADNVKTVTATIDVGQITDSRISDERRQRWLALLSKRPSTKDGNSMSDWLVEVLSVSDLETPLKQMESTEDDAKIKGVKRRDNVDESLKKRAEKNTNESQHSTDNSSNDESVDNDEKHEVKEKHSSAVFSAGLVKKKRPSSDLLREGSEQKPKSNSYVRGSFAEWKERKKQKKQSKSSGNPQNSAKQESS